MRRNATTAACMHDHKVEMEWDAESSGPPSGCGCGKEEINQGTNAATPSSRG